MDPKHRVTDCEFFGKVGVGDRPRGSRKISQSMDLASP